MNDVCQHMLAFQSSYRLNLNPYFYSPSGDALAPADTAMDKLERGEEKTFDDHGQVRLEQSHRLPWSFV